MRRGADDATGRVVAIGDSTRRAVGDVAELRGRRPLFGMPRRRRLLLRARAPARAVETDVLRRHGDAAAREENEARRARLRRGVIGRGPGPPGHGLCSFEKRDAQDGARVTRHGREKRPRRRVRALARRGRPSQALPAAVGQLQTPRARGGRGGRLLAAPRGHEPRGPGSLGAPVRGGRRQGAVLHGHARVGREFTRARGRLQRHGHLRPAARRQRGPIDARRLADLRTRGPAAVRRLRRGDAADDVQGAPGLFAEAGEGGAHRELPRASLGGRAQRGGVRGDGVVYSGRGPLARPYVSGGPAPAESARVRM
mmetsp:Transcript_29719/g.91906  ORF Transcript_29719/g.91906 Transcript_29719/m.91906 type:complete len:312 (-) Transcript_29719:4182-5117(-)